MIKYYLDSDIHKFLKIHKKIKPIYVKYNGFIGVPKFMTILQQITILQRQANSQKISIFIEKSILIETSIFMANL